MEGEKKLLLMSELVKAVEPLVIDQSFNVLFFNVGQPAVAFPGELKPATRRFKDDLSNFLETVAMSGQTNPNPALRAAFDMEPELIFFLTDGQFNGVTNYDAVLSVLDELNPDRTTMVNTIQFITRDERAEEVLRKIATEHGGTYKYVSRDDL
jgi:hypothetical protein